MTEAKALIAKTALRLEMAEGRVQSLGGGGTGGSEQMDEAATDRDLTRETFHGLILEATGLTPQRLAWLLSL